MILVNAFEYNYLKLLYRLKTYEEADKNQYVNTNHDR